MIFYLGTHEPSWLGRTTVPLFVSVRRLRRLRNLPIPIGSWALGSGGFTEIERNGGWRTTAGEYAGEVTRIRREMPGLRWVAPQDWMCEPFMLARTGLTIAAHQALGPIVIPVLQGWHLDDYTAAGVDLETEPIVGLGSVCRRQATGSAEAIVWALQPLRLHGFGMKTLGIRHYGAGLASSDSMA